MPTLQDWINACRMTAAAAGDVTADQHRIGPVGFLRHMHTQCARTEPGAGIDETLWLAAVDASITADQIQSLVGSAGPIHQQQPTQAIELWTERELGALHALWRLAQLRSNNTWRQRAREAALWHTEHTQPDNATNHPWAIGAFLDLWNVDPDSEQGASAKYYAEVLLHNCQMTNGKPDPLSALILLDAADGLSMLMDDSG